MPPEPVARASAEPADPGPRRSAEPPDPGARASAEPADPGPRRSAGERRRQLVEAAVGAFAHTGLHGTAVSAVTDRVGVTQPYAFSLFRTKKGLFLAAVEHCFDHVEQTFRAGAAGRSGADALEAMGDAYHALLEDRDWLLLQLQAYAACGDEEVRAVVRRRFAALYELVGELSGAEDLELRDFFAAGMLMNVAAAMDLPELAAEEEGWIERCRAPLRP